MATTLDQATKVFSVPQADLNLVSGTFYTQDTNAWRLEVGALMDNEAYIWMDVPVSHNTEVTIAGTVYARTLELINGYSITYTPDSAWTVQQEGSNNNFFSVSDGILNQNGVQVIPTNSAGLIASPKIDEVHTRLGLEEGNAITDTPTGIDSADGSIDIERTGDGVTSSTLTRQP